jgi:RNA polymerase sigma-70 factor (ECF subfamily)
MLAFKESLDERVLHELMRRHYPAALRIAESRLRDRLLAEEAVQDAFLRIVRHRRRFKPDRRFCPWFFTILFNLCEDYRRKEIRYTAKLKEFTPEGEAHFSGGDAEERVRAALDTLPSLDREVLLLRFAHETPFREIAEVLGLSTEAAKKRALRAMQRLRSVFGQTTHP